MKFLRLLFLTAFFCLSFFLGFAQPGGGGKPCPKPPCPPAVPISGIEILIGGGVLLGLKRMLNRSKTNKE